ncbi:probable protein S-acyltransferase 15 isoform X1 [Actinidia eriantha]|uniref:probable protein S-acyltransferase 15 isoform X1 n=1 Tax=Actinidia eriantha TaxID=165200 RepID=UPI00258AFEAA|nr:probable protein S-acyltransferase 15 isoform X1 [Actinidia eriantha]
MKGRRFLSIPVFSVFLVLGFVYYVTVFIFLEDWLGLQTSAGSLNALIFTFLAFLSLFSFFACVLTDPGGVPSSYVPDVEDSGVTDQELKKTGIQRGQCDKCFGYKPPRAHHCRKCKRCILRMDHHCMWINNCVGNRNYKAFIVLVFYATMSSFYSSVVIICCAIEKDWNFVGSIPLKVFYICSGAMTVGIFLTLGTLLGWHIYLMIQNMTTIEHSEAVRAAWLARKSGQNYRHPFNVGVFKNITLILGPNMLKWFCPTAVSHIKDGITFPTMRDSS